MAVSEAISAGIRETNDLFCSRMIGKRDFEAIDLIYTSNAKILPPGAPMIGGRAQIKEFWKQAVTGMDVKSATLDTVNAEQTGNSVLEIGKANLTLSNGQSLDVKYFVQWKQEDGRWKLEVDIWNLNQA